MCKEPQGVVWLCAFQLIIVLTNARPHCFFDLFLLMKRQYSSLLFSAKQVRAFQKRAAKMDVTKYSSNVMMRLTLRKGCCVPNASCVRPTLALEWWNTANSLTGSVSHACFWMVTMWGKAKMQNSNNPQRFMHAHTFRHEDTIANKSWPEQHQPSFSFFQSSYLFINRVVLRTLHPFQEASVSVQPRVEERE